jgi:hypothetical protein
MPQIDVIIYNGFQHSRNATFNNTQTNDYIPSGHLCVSGLTAGETYFCKINSGQNYANIATVGRVTAASTSALLSYDSRWNDQKIVFYNVAVTNLVLEPAFFSVHNLSMVTVCTAWVRPVYPHSHEKHGQWSVTQNADKSVKVAITNYETVQSWSVLYSLQTVSASSFVLDPSEIRSIYEVKLQDIRGNTLATEELKPNYDASLPSCTFDSSLISVTSIYTVKISSLKLRSENVEGGGYFASASTQSLYIHSTLTASTVTSGESSNMYSWLDNSYWYLTDLQVNLGTRAVTHRHGTIQLRPSDTINFAILFHNGTAGIDPQATDIKLAVRSSNNTSPYHFWSAATVSTVTVSGDVYYAITITASDDDLLTAQAANLLAGSNADQSLLGEIQWTTTRGTFSSDTFTINVPSEVVREPDV